MTPVSSILNAEFTERRRVSLYQASREDRISPKLAALSQPRLVVLQSRILMERDPLSLNFQMCILEFLLQPNDPKSKEDTRGLHLGQLLLLLRERAIREKERVIKWARGREKIGKPWGSSNPRKSLGIVAAVGFVLGSCGI